MLKLFTFGIVSSIFALTLGDNVAFTCPTTTITAVTLGGNLPIGATDTVVVPKNTNCTFNFIIPDGYALKLLLSANFANDNDHVVVFDNLGQASELTHSNTAIRDALIWIASGVAQINVVGQSGQSTFLTKYMYSSLNNYMKVNVPTGQPFQLSKVTGNSYYTINSAKNDKVVATVGRPNTNTTDSTLQYIFAYDGANLTTAKMIGRLSDPKFLRNAISTSGSSLTLVNFYGTRSNSWVLGNDNAAVKNYRKYSVIVTSLGGFISGALTDGSDAGSAYTFYCTNCKEMYLNQLGFDSMLTFNNGFVTVQGQSPTHGMEKLINYSSMSTTSASFPQYIPSGMFTMVVKMSGINLVVSASNVATAWQKPVDGRKGYVFSPNLWDPSAFGTFASTFSNDSTLFNYKVNFLKTSFGNKQNDKLSVKIGSSSGSFAINNEYPRDTSANGMVSANGNFLTLSYAGGVGSDIRLSFEMKEVSGSAAIGFLTSVILSLYYLF